MIADFAICKYCLDFWEKLAYAAGLLDTLSFMLIAWYLRKLARRPR
jgi:AhpD family alkylhydroperoxidase